MYYRLSVLKTSSGCLFASNAVYLSVFKSNTWRR
ncbi:hypothetical protein ALP99_200059 [Pseudomonas syringae pv. tomato]|uniref:Uncharacterized protein n=1 Tax=Pseudomonas syringae pv. tomato TaxID=323 RepID=A0AAQ0NE94_PSEUB|nr:hypothetical protein PST407_05498 [Pseudomonas syringae pv. tomato]KUR45793.1 hypothetical protein PSTA9_02260 [Pseudomonas syringae pv. tomato]RMQ79616.1 hypothetical protein ALP99_200059 [Pseudomonas syringae pv. tomato]CAI8723625.1 hypothetical protein DAPPPG215_00665 [Pseudomonas syringae pv. tomato]